MMEGYNDEFVSGQWRSHRADPGVKALNPLGFSCPRIESVQLFDSALNERAITRNGK